MSDEQESTLQELLKLGQLGLDTGFWAEAEAYYERALRISPGHPEALLGRALACRTPRRALDAVRALLAVVPDSPEGLRLEAELLERISDADKELGGNTKRARKRPEGQPGARSPWSAIAAVGAVCVLLVAVSWFASPDLRGLVADTLAPVAPGLAMPAAEGTATPLSVDSEFLSQAFAATVLIVTTDPTGHWMQRGSGVVVDELGLILTNHHVLADDRGRLLNDDGLAFIGFSSDVRRAPDRWYIAAAVALDPQRDLAVLRILSTEQGKSLTGHAFQPIALRQDGDLSLGEGLVGLGYPALGGETVTLTRGSMAGFASAQNEIHLGKTDSELLPGSSGGAVLDSQGRLVGIITLTMTEARTQGRLSYFVLIDEAEDLLLEARQAPRPVPSLRWMRNLFQAGMVGR